MIKELNNKIFNDKKILVSITCLAYNHEPYIRECLDGFIMQKTNFAFEVIIHDDASTDNTANIIREYEINYPEIIKPIFQIENQHSKGISVAVKYNWPRAKGKYIATCEGDDYWTDPLKLQKQVDFLEMNEEYGLVHTNFDTYYQNSKYLLKNTHTIYGIDLKDNCSLEYWNLFGKAMATIKTLTVCFRRDLIEGWRLATPKNNWLVGDFPMYFYASLHSKIGYIQESTSVSRTFHICSVRNVGNNNLMKLNIKKSYVDIRLHFFKKYKLNEENFKKALIRDINLLLDFCIITNNEVVLKEYLKKYESLKLRKKTNVLSRCYLQSNNIFQKRVLYYVVKMKIFTKTSLFKILNPKFVVSTIQRKLSYLK